MEGPQFNTASALLSLQKGCGLWTLSCDFVHHFLHCSAQWRMKINSTCLSRTRLLFGEISDSIFCLQDSSYPVIQWSSYPVIQWSSYHLSSVVCRHSSSVYSLPSIIFLSVHLYLSLPCLHWRLVDGCCLLALHLSGVVVGRCNSAAAVCDTCRHPSPCPVAGMGLLVMTWCRLSHVFFIVDECCDCCHASTLWTSVLSSLGYWFDQCS